MPIQGQAWLGGKDLKARVVLGDQHPWMSASPV